MTPGNPLTEAAIGWRVRTADPGFEDWAGFTDWLEQSPAHADAYHRVVAAESELLPVLAEERTVQDNAPAPARPARRVLPVAGLAAGIAAAAALFLVPALSPDSYRTRPGEQRTIALAGGNRMVLNGDTAVTLAGWNKGEVRVERGQALFRLSGSETVAVSAGDLDLVDIGTQFEVSRDGPQTRVVVSEGAVLVDPDGARLRLDAGEQLVAADGAARLRAAPAPAGAAGAFARGQLVYRDAAVVDVAADLRRSTGLVITANAASGARRFTGTLNLADVRRDPMTLGPLLGVPARPAGDGWVLGED